MSDMKCPKCGGKLVYWGATGALLKCSQCNFGWGNEELWQELIRTRKALEVAKDALNTIKGKHDPRCAVYHIDEKTAYDALEQITALEQKDVK